MVRQLEELRDVFENNPLIENGEIEFIEPGAIKTLYVTFLSEAPDKSDWEKINPDEYAPERFSLRGRAIYLHFPAGAHKAKLSNNFFEKKLNLEATTRNWRTVSKLVEMASG